MDIVSPGVWITQDMILSDVGMIAKNIEISYHMKRYPYVPFQLDPVVANAVDMPQSVFEGEFDEMCAERARALNIPLNIFNIS